jgi:hypothetical protein
MSGIDALYYTDHPCGEEYPAEIVRGLFLNSQKNRGYFARDEGTRAEYVHALQPMIMTCWQKDPAFVVAELRLTRYQSPPVAAVIRQFEDYARHIMLGAAKALSATWRGILMPPPHRAVWQRDRPTHGAFVDLSLSTCGFQVPKS